MLRIKCQKNLNAQRCYRTLFVGHNKATSSDLAIAKSFTSLTLYYALFVFAFLNRYHKKISKKELFLYEE